MGKTRRGGRAREGHVRRRLLLRGRHRESAEPTRVRLLTKRTMRRDVADHPRKTAGVGDESCRATAMFKKAADLGDKRAAQRLRGNSTGPIAHDSIVQRDRFSGDGGDTARTKDKDCVIM